MVHQYGLALVRCVNDNDDVTVKYPDNPNESIYGIAGIFSVMVGIQK